MLNTFQYRFRVSDPERDSGMIYVDSERDAETEGPEFSSGSIQHDIFGHLVFTQQILNRKN